MEHMGLKMTIYSGTLKLRMRFWKQRAAKKKTGNFNKMMPGTFFAPKFLVSILSFSVSLYS